MATVDNRLPTEGTQKDILAALEAIKNAINLQLVAAQITVDPSNFMYMDDVTTTNVQLALERLDSGVYQTAADITSLIETYLTLLPLKVTIPNVSSLPTTVTVPRINAQYVVIESTLSNAAAQIGDWTVTTGTSSLTVSGAISGTTDITLLLMESRTS